jgi:hydroxymethylglutaryl-CoA synthase
MKYTKHNTIGAGIESISFYVPHYYFDLQVLAEVRGTDPGKYIKGIGQERMAVPAPDEDVVTMGANAAAQAMEGIDRASIDTLMFATESGIDQSKAAAIYVHELLGLPASCKAFELKQACCSGTAGLMMALAWVRQRPDKKVLLVASDIARYGLGTAGEATQGAGAVAMVISANPRILSIGLEHGSYTEDVMDFWRPNYRDEARVDGKYSIRVYLKALAEAWRGYVDDSGRRFGEHERFCYHLPFTRMAEKAHLHLGKTAKAGLSRDELLEQVESSLIYNRWTGNIYTASLYVGLTSLLENEPGQAGRRLGLFSYGSGCLAYFFSGLVADGYEAALCSERHHRMLEQRQALSYDEYEAFYNGRLPQDGTDCALAAHRTGQFRLAGVEDEQRIYRKVETATESVDVEEPADTDAQPATWAPPKAERMAM